MELYGLLYNCSIYVVISLEFDFYSDLYNKMNHLRFQGNTAT